MTLILVCLGFGEHGREPNRGSKPKTNVISTKLCFFLNFLFGVMFVHFGISVLSLAQVGSASPCHGLGLLGLVWAMPFFEFSVRGDGRAGRLAGLLGCGSCNKQDQQAGAWTKESLGKHWDIQ